MKKEIKKRIIEILRNSPFKGELFKGQCEFWANQLLDLFKEEEKKWIEEIEKMKINL